MEFYTCCTDSLFLSDWLFYHSSCSAESGGSDTVPDPSVKAGPDGGRRRTRRYIPAGAAESRKTSERFRTQPITASEMQESCGYVAAGYNGFLLHCACGGQKGTCCYFLLIFFFFFNGSQKDMKNNWTIRSTKTAHVESHLGTSLIYTDLIELVQSKNKTQISFSK